MEDEKSVPPYSLDCYVAELHLGFEADGGIYHSGPRKRAKDRERDWDILNQYGIHVLRLTDRELVSSMATTIIQQFIDENAESAETRRQVARGLV